MAPGALMGKLRTNRRGNATTIDFSGPFFEGDPEKQFDENVDEMLQAMSAEGRADVIAQIDSHVQDMEHSTGWSVSRVASRTYFPWREGKGYSLVWTSTLDTQGRPQVADRASRTKNARGNLAGDFKGNVAARTKAAMSTIEGRWHPFRVTSSRLRKSRAVNMAELTKGIE
jgi:hypothetical protein